MQQRPFWLGFVQQPCLLMCCCLRNASCDDSHTKHTNGDHKETHTHLASTGAHTHTHTHTHTSPCFQSKLALREVSCSPKLHNVCNAREGLHLQKIRGPFSIASVMPIILNTSRSHQKLRPTNYGYIPQVIFVRWSLP